MPESSSRECRGPHDPETSRQVEGGAKTEWLSGRLQFTTAYFDAAKRNVLRPDPLLGPTGTNPNAVLATGEARNRGIELDVVGAIVPWWNVAFNYAYLDSEIMRDANAAIVGHRLPNAAPHTLGLFSRVDMPHGRSVAGILAYVADREEPYAGIRAPGYAIVDAHFFQQVGRLARVIVKAENLFDRHYAANSLFAARAGNIPGQPRTLSVSLTLSTR
jgi:iron complex outermembrane recepter protein